MKTLPLTFVSSCLPENIASNALPGMEHSKDFFILIPISPPMSKSRMLSLSDISFFNFSICVKLSFTKEVFF